MYSEITTIGELPINRLLHLVGKRIRLGKQKDFFMVRAISFDGYNGRHSGFYVCFWKAPRNVVQKIAKRETEIEIL